MWNGDGKPVVWVFGIDYFKKFMKEHPNCILSDKGDWWQIYDCYDEHPEEELDCWYCDECESIAVFTGEDKYRYDFEKMETVNNVSRDNIANWQDYVALKDRPFEDFQDWYEGRNPLAALEEYEFEYRYKVSPDKKFVYAIDSNGEVAFGYKQTRFLVLKQ